MKMNESKITKIKINSEIHEKLYIEELHLYQIYHILYKHIAMITKKN